MPPWNDLKCEKSLPTMCSLVNKAFLMEKKKKNWLQGELLLSEENVKS